MNKKMPGLLIAVLATVVSCSRNVYTNNGESIYKTGRNLAGERMLDKSASSIKFIKSCRGCHGRNGDAMKNVSIKFKDLDNAANRAVPYNDSLFFRFLDHDIKSDGAKANIGVLWKMSDKDKQDLLEYLKTL